MLNDTLTVRSKNRRVKAYSPPNPFEFPLADARVLITYKNTEVTAILSSHALSLCSPVWRNFLNPPWQVTGEKRAYRKQHSANPPTKNGLQKRQCRGIVDPLQHCTHQVLRNTSDSVDIVVLLGSDSL